MNAQRRKALGKIEALLCEARGLLDGTAAEEREAYENLPESIQNSERGERAEEIATTLEEAVYEIENIETALAESRG